tara:strand:- start:175 stop:510 length:336 start_codon:yes stop_codon:yes gene_type:complete
MGELTILNETPVTLTEVKEKLTLIEKEKTLTFRGEKTKEYLSNFVKLPTKEIENLKNKIAELNIPRLKDRHITKIIDVLPKDIDSIKIMLSGETITIKEEDLKRILDVIPQ